VVLGGYGVRVPPLKGLEIRWGHLPRTPVLGYRLYRSSSSAEVNASPHSLQTQELVVRAKLAFATMRLRCRAFAQGGLRGSDASAPVQHVVAVHSQAKQVGGNEPELRGSNSDDADDSAIGAGNNPTLPFVSAHQIGREQGKRARDVVETKQINQVRTTMRTSCCPSLVTIASSV
jgi:hypothetical protein